MRKNSYHEFVIKGLNQERFFNKISKKYDVFDINRYEKNKTSFKVDIKNGKNVKKEILSSNFEILGEKRCGLVAKFFDIKNYIGIITAVFVCLFAFFMQFSFIWRVKVDGVNGEMRRDIISYIDQNYLLKKNIDCKQIEVDLRDNFEELSFASVAVVGQTLVINAKEGVQPIEKTGMFEQITAPCDCRIVKVKLIQGTLVISEGDSIKCGGVIVEPYIIDSFGQKKSVEAKAEIVYQTWVDGEESHSEEEYVSERTGRTYAKNELFLFGLKIYEHNGKSVFNEFEKEVTEKYFTKNNILPFFFRKTIYYETKKVLVCKTYTEVREEKIVTAKQKALQKVGESDKIVEENVFESQLNGVYLIKYRITLEREIK